MMPIDFTKGFPNFIREERTRGATDLHEPPAQALSPSFHADQSVSDDVSEAMAEWERLGPDGVARLAYVKTLSETLQLDLFRRLTEQADRTNADRDRQIHEKVSTMFADFL